MEVVLADGRVLNTGFGHYPDAKAARVYRYGLGPFLDGLFSQSNYGIVTKIGLWLLPEPEVFNFYYFKVSSREGLAELIDQIRPLRMAGILRTAIHIGNDYRRVRRQLGDLRLEQRGESHRQHEIEDTGLHRAVERA